MQDHFMTIQVSRVINQQLGQQKSSVYMLYGLHGRSLECCYAISLLVAEDKL